MFLPLGSHDTERFLTLCGGDRRKMALAVVLQMSFMGSPSIYYGDECGMEGENDPDCRRCMIWEESERDQELYELYRSLIRIRKKEPALRTGRQRTILCCKDVYGYFRGEGRNAIYILVNTGVDDCDLRVPVVSEGYRLCQRDVSGYCCRQMKAGRKGRLSRQKRKRSSIF